MALRTLGDARNTGQQIIAICHNPACRRRVDVDLDGLIYLIGALTSLTPVHGSLHFSERLRCAACRHRGFFLWIEEPKAPEPWMGDVRNNQVNLWGKYDGSLEQVVARTSRTELGHVAFDAAMRLYPNRRVTLQEGARIVRDSRLSVIRGGRA